jgi:hypothetical protein
MKVQDTFIVYLVQGEKCRGTREKGCHINEGPGYIYCVETR